MLWPLYVCGHVQKKFVRLRLRLRLRDEEGSKLFGPSTRQKTIDSLSNFQRVTNPLITFNLKAYAPSKRETISIVCFKGAPQLGQVRPRASFSENLTTIIRGRRGCGKPELFQMACAQSLVSLLYFCRWKALRLTYSLCDVYQRVPRQR